MKNPQEHISLSARLGRAIVLLVLVLVTSALIIAQISAWRRASLPFLGMMLEPTLVISPYEGEGWERLRLDPGCRRPASR